MAKNLDIIKGAMKKLRVLPGGAEPDAAEAADGMEALQGMIVEIVGQGALGRFTDVLATSDYTAREFERVRADEDVTVTVPTVITPDLDPCGGGYDYGFRSQPVTGSSDRAPRDWATIIVVSDNGDGSFDTAYHVYTAAKGSWIEVQAMDQQDDFPFAADLEEGFKALLAERLSDQFEQKVGQQTALQASGCRQAISLKLGSASRRTPAEYF